MLRLQFIHCFPDGSADIEAQNETCDSVTAQIVPSIIGPYQGTRILMISIPNQL